MLFVVIGKIYCDIDCSMSNYGHRSSKDDTEKKDVMYCMLSILCFQRSSCVKKNFL